MLQGTFGLLFLQTLKLLQKISLRTDRRNQVPTGPLDVRSIDWLITYIMFMLLSFCAPVYIPSFILPFSGGGFKGLSISPVSPSSSESEVIRCQNNQRQGNECGGGGPGDEGTWVRSVKG